VSKPLIIVESPAKARTISKFLGNEYVVESSIGHIRDLPSKAAEIPQAHRKKQWARTGVDIENDFQPLYIVPQSKKAQVKKLKDLLKEASALYLATDEDREGEAIAWHLKEVLKPKVPVKRMVFHEITKKAIDAAIDNPRDLDERLVDAQEARRILDRLFGYEISPVLWKKVRPRLSAGRVQSVATRLIVERERARMAFHKASYWDVSTELKAEVSSGPSAVGADVHSIEGRRIASGKDFDPDTGARTENAKRDKILLLDEPAAKAVAENIKGKVAKVIDVKQTPFTQRPSAPFITSTLQQEAGRKLRYTAKRAMRVAQRLYENGYITYMRTDSTTLSAEAVSAARTQVTDLYGAEYLPDEPRVYTKKAKGAQEAHEAIRPAGEKFRTPESLKNELDDESIKLYELIWKRTVASQMKDAKGQRTSMKFEAQLTVGHEVDGLQLNNATATLTASGRVITFPGFLRAYVEGSDDPDAALDDKDKILPALQVGDTPNVAEASASGHETKPPARYTEASLVKEMEERGIGRPSTYASIIQTVQDRGYVWKKSGGLVPTLTAFAVTNLLEKHFQELVRYEFTARMEDELDSIASGEQQAVPWLKTFYFGETGKAVEEPKPDAPLNDVGLHGKVDAGVEHIDARGICSLPIAKTDEGEEIAARVGRYGPYLQVGDSDTRANLPEEIVPDELDKKQAMELIRQAQIANRTLGDDPESGKPVYLKSGRYGPYVQLGDPELTPKGNIKKGSKPRMASLFPDMDIVNLTLEQGLFCLTFPKVLGQHPEHKVDIIAADGQFGPYITMELEDGKKESRSLEGHDQLKAMDLNKAIELFKQPKQRKGFKRGPVGPLATLEGKSPVTGKPLEIRDGRFGAYVTDGEVNATIPSGRDPTKISFDFALELIAQREERMRAQGKDPRPKGGAKKKATKKAPAKAGAKKATKKKATKKKATKKKAPAKAGAKKKATKKRAKKA
jgi:DNA topoisomerase-1